MKRAIFSGLAACAAVALASGCVGKAAGTYRLNWQQEPVRYAHFTDAGKYLLIQEDVDYSECAKVLEDIGRRNDLFKAGCTATAKLNRKGEVILGRNMDVEISQNPAVMTRIVGGPHEVVSFFYGGVNTKYTYAQLDEIDADVDFLRQCAFKGTDAMNEAGLYVEANMREMDDEVDLYCSGVNPGKPRACLLSAPVIIAANCATVPEALAFLQDSYDWYTLGYHDKLEDKTALWNLALMIGDAQGNFGLVEFAQNKIRFTPYANGQGNYYIHPSIAEYADVGTGYGRLAAALEGLPACETAEDMLHNMEACMWRREILDPGCLGYSDAEGSLAARRALSQDALQRMMEKEMEPHQAAAREFYAGNEGPLRDDGTIWTTGFNFGVNCAEKRLVLRLWESDGAIVDYRW